MLLENKNAVIYGAGGGIGGAMARSFAAEGARLFLTGRTREKLAGLAADIGAAGGTAEVADFDALDRQAVDEHADAVAAQGGLHISFNLIGHPANHGTPMVEMDVDDYLQPVEKAVRSNFLTIAAATRHMKDQGDGVILFFGGVGGSDARLLPGRHSGRLRGARVDAAPALGGARQGRRSCRDAADRRRARLRAGLRGPRCAKPIVDDIAGRTMLGRAATFEDIGNAAVFAASDRGRIMTAATVNVSAGALVD